MLFENIYNGKLDDVWLDNTDKEYWEMSKSKDNYGTINVIINGLNDDIYKFFCIDPNHADKQEIIATVYAVIDTESQ